MNQPLPDRLPDHTAGQWTTTQPVYGEIELAVERPSTLPIRTTPPGSSAYPVTRCLRATSRPLNGRPCRSGTASTRSRNPWRPVAHWVRVSGGAVQLVSAFAGVAVLLLLAARGGRGGRTVNITNNNRGFGRSSTSA